MIPLRPLTQMFVACGANDRRNGFDGLAPLVKQALQHRSHAAASTVSSTGNRKRYEAKTSLVVT